MRKIQFFILALLFVGFSSTAQDYLVIDSLKDELQNAQNNDKKNILFALSWEYRKSHPDSTIYYCHQILGLLDENVPSKNIAKVMNFMGVAYHYKGNDVEAFKYYNRALETAKEAGDSLQVAHALNNLGRFYMNQGDHVQSYDHYRSALEIFKNLKDYDGQSYGYKSLGELYLSQKNFDKALEMAQITLDLRRHTNNIHGQISVLNEMAEIYMDKEELDNALTNYEESMLLASDIQDWAMVSNIHLGMAKLFCMKNEFEIALNEADKAKQISDRINNQSLDNNINLMFGRLLVSLGRYDEAEIYLNELLAEVVSSKDLSLEQMGSYYLARIYQETGRYEKGFEKFKRHHELASILESTENARMIERLESRLVIESTLKENELLVARQDAYEATQSRLRMQNVLLTVGILAAFIIVLILYLLYKKRMEVNRKLVQKNNFIASQREEIRKQNMQIADQNEKLLQRNENLALLNNEKDTLMNILAHDLKAPFNRVKGLTQLMELTELSKEQQKYAKMLNGATSNGLDLIRDLLEVSAFSNKQYKPAFTPISLNDQLEEKKESFRTEADTKHIELTILQESNVTVLTDPSYLSRILDNLISNAIKFSNPGTQVILSGGKKNGIVFISVKDFGPGFSESDRKNLYSKFARLSAQPTAGESSNGLGLAIVKILVDSLKGEIELISEPGNGSEFLIRFPKSLTIDNPVKDKA